MTDIEQKALALVNEIERKFQFCGNELTSRIMRGSIWDEALCRAIEQHEAFRQEVSDVVEAYVNATNVDDWVNLKSLIITEPDPLEEVLYGVWFSDPKEDAKALRAALEARGFEIREKKDD